MTTEVSTAQDSGNTNRRLRARAFQFTVFKEQCLNYILDELKKLKSCDYFIACEELAPITMNKHWHIYAHFSSSYTLSKKFLDTNVHIEICRGSPQQNIAYIEKDGDIIEEYGKRPNQGSKTVSELKELENPDELDWKEYNTWLKIHTRPKPIIIDDWLKTVKVYFIWGPSGAGKSFRAKNIILENGYHSFDEVSYTNGFWNGVTEKCKCCIYDDFRSSHMKASEFIKFIDYNIHTINIKGGFVQNNYTLIIFTSVQNPEELYYKSNPFENEEPNKQWLRRITVERVGE